MSDSHVLEKAPASVERSFSNATRRVSAIVPALVASLLGAVIIFGVGFAGSETIHNAAHDSRHSINFPCH